MTLTKAQIDFLYSLDYVSKEEIKDLMGGFTELDVILDPDDLEKFNAL